MPKKFFLEEITKWVDEGSPVDVIYLDFQKAFDNVPHQRLILKLKSHGMGNSIIKCREYNIPLCVAFVDYEKAFDSVQTQAILT